MAAALLDLLHRHPGDPERWSDWLVQDDELVIARYLTSDPVKGLGAMEAGLKAIYFHISNLREDERGRWAKVEIDLQRESEVRQLVATTINLDQDHFRLQMVRSGWPQMRLNGHAALYPEIDLKADLDTVVDAIWEAAEFHHFGPCAPMAAPSTYIFSARTLAEKQLPEQKMMVPGILPEGLTAFGGKPKMGKSLLFLGLSVAVASGGKALGQIDVPAGDVLYIAAEDNDRRLKGRLLTVCGDDPIPARLDLAIAWPKLDAGGLELIESWLMTHPDARLVGVDTLTKVRAGRKRNGNAYEEDYAAVAGLKTLADKYQVAIVIILHLRKADAEDPVDAISGTLGLAGGCDGVLVLKRERGRHDATLFVTGRDVEEQELALNFDREHALWSICGTAAEGRMSNERQSVIYVLTQAAGPLGPKEIALAMGRTSPEKYAATKVLIGQMVKDGQIRNLGRGSYGLNQPKTTGTENALTSLTYLPSQAHEDPPWELIPGAESAQLAKVSEVSLVSEVTKVSEVIADNPIPLTSLEPKRERVVSDTERGIGHDRRVF